MNVSATADRAELSAALRTAAVVIAGRDLGVTLSSARVTAGPSGGTVEASDGVQHVRAAVPSLIGTGSALVPVARTLGFVAAVKADAVTLEGGPSGLVLAARGAGKIALPYADPAALPGPAKAGGNGCEATLPAAALANALDAASAACDPTAMHVRNTALSGTHLEIEPTCVTAVCSDQVSCAAARADASTNGTGSGTLPAAVAKLFSHALAGAAAEEPSTLFISPNSARLIAGRVTAQGPLLQMKFPNWRRWIHAGRTGEIQLKKPASDAPEGLPPTTGVLEYAANAAEAANAVRLAATAADKVDGSPSVLLTFRDGTCTAESRGDLGGVAATAEFGGSAVGHTKEAQARLQAARLAKILSACGNGPAKLFVGENAVGLESGALSATIARIHHAEEGGQ